MGPLVFLVFLAFWLLSLVYSVAVQRWRGYCGSPSLVIASVGIVFRGIQKGQKRRHLSRHSKRGCDGKNEGMSAGPVNVIDMVDTKNSDFFQFDDPVIKWSPGRYSDSSLLTF